MTREQAMREAAQRLGMQAADIPGLWWIPGYPELTTAQMQQVVERHAIERGAHRAAARKAPE